MVSIEMKLQVFSELMDSIGCVTLWNYDGEGRLVSCSSENAEILDNLFVVGGTKKSILDYLKGQDAPCIVLDSLSLAWIATAHKVNGMLINMYMIGPVFTSRASEKSIMASIRNTKVSAQWKDHLLSLLLTMPIIPHTQFMQFGIMLHRCVTGINVGVQDIEIIRSEASVGKKKKEADAQRKSHTGYFYEQQLMQAIETGNIHFKHPENPPEVGVLSTDDPLRQAKNEAIVFTTIVVRSALRGGMPEETAYSLSDYYIQSIEAQNNISDVFAIDELVFADFLKRMYQFKMSAGRSREIQNCTAYIQSHITEKIDHEQMAQQLGYSRNHLSAKFKKEMGLTMNEYINQQRIETAKQWLLNTNKAIQDIADALNFGTVSYFGAKFREHTGVSPSEYRRGKGI